MGYKLDKAIIENRAEQVLKDFACTTLPIDPRAIAEKENILVKPKSDCTPGVSAMLLKQGDNVGILYAIHHNNHGFENFSIAHELGHYFLDGHTDYLFKTNEIHTSKAGDLANDKIEHEADTFAAALLMPRNLFKDALSNYEKGLSCIEGMANLCNTSLTATAIRYAELTDDKVVVIISTNGVIDYCQISQSVFSLRDVEIPHRWEKIMKDTETYKFAQNPEKVLRRDKGCAETRFIDWLECRSSKSAYEEVIGLGNYGKVLTVIS